MAQTKLRAGQIPVDTDDTLAADSDELVPSQKAVKAYVASVGGVALSTDTPADIGSAGAAGSGTEASKDDHVHQGVSSLAKSGSSALHGAVTLSPGANISLTQSGNDIAIASTGSAAVPYVHVRDEKAQNTSGGTFSSGAWRTRTLNTEVTDTDNIASLASNQITLPAGTYRIFATAPAFQVGRHQLRLQDVTNAVTLLLGDSQYMAAGNYDVSVAHLRGQFTLSGSAAIELQHQCTNTFNTEGFGVVANFGTEIYAIVELWKVA